MKNSQKVVAVLLVVVLATSIYFYMANGTSQSRIDETLPNIGQQATLIKNGMKYQLSYGNTEDDQCLTLNSENQNKKSSASSTKICMFTVDTPILNGVKEYSFTDPSLDLQDITFSGLTVIGEAFSVKVDLDLGQSSIRSYSCTLSDFSSTSKLTCLDETETVDSNQNESTFQFTDFVSIKKYILSRGVSIPILLPQYLPKDFSLTNGDASLVANVTADDSGYDIVLGYGDCGDVCSALYMAASKGKPDGVYDEKITLSNGIVGYYSSGPTEGTGAGLASIEWGYDGYVYTIQNYSKSFLIEMADSATSVPVSQYITQNTTQVSASSSLATSTISGFSMDDPNDPIFTSTFGKTYATAKKELAENGWLVDMSVISSSSPSANDSQFPEINGCGSGLDMVCSVSFKKGTMTASLDVQIGGRALSGPYSGWTVVGND